MIYNAYSDYLKKRYQQKVYKLPVNIPCTCPNRDGSKGFGGCIFCGEKGSGYELQSHSIPIIEQLNKNRALIEKKYNAHKFIAYFQSFSNTYLDFNHFQDYINQALEFKDLVELAISTRPDCIDNSFLEFLEKVKFKNNIDITIELGLQTSNNATLKILNRQHTLEDYLDASLRIKKHNLRLCTHLILDLPWDNLDDILRTADVLNNVQTNQLKIHSLYIIKGTPLERMYLEGLKLLPKEDYINRSIFLLERINPNIVIERLVGRVPEKESIYSNWDTSWWKIRDEIINTMKETHTYQGKLWKKNQ